MAERLSVLWVAAPSEPRPRLLEELSVYGVDITHALTCDEARRRLAEEKNFGLVISATHLADGNWYSVLSSLVYQGGDAGFVVVADEVSDSFRQRVRDHGGIDAVELGAAMPSASLLSQAVQTARA